MQKSLKVINRQKFESLLKNSYERIRPDEAAMIIGGDPTPSQMASVINSLSNIFIQGNDCTGAYWQEFNNQVGLLATTNVGFDMLTQIVNSVGVRHITVTGIDPGLGSNGAVYRKAPNGGYIDLGALILPTLPITEWNYTRQLALNFGTIAHELYHAFYYIVNGNSADFNSYWTSIRSELDAFIFETMSNNEVDGKNNTIDSLKSYAYWDYNIYASPNSLPAGTSFGSIKVFKIAWYDIFHNKNFTLNNYNKLVAKFTTSSAQGAGYSNLNASPPLTQSDFTASSIYNFYNLDYSQSSYFSTYPLLFPFSDPLLGLLLQIVPTTPPPEPNDNANVVTPVGGGNSITYGGGSGGGGNYTYTYIPYNDPGAPGSGGWVYVGVLGDPGSGGSGGSGSSGGSGGGGGTSPRTWHFGGSQGAIWDDNGEPLTPEELRLLDLAI